jgi:hypothetical protein
MTRLDAAARQPYAPPCGVIATATLNLAPPLERGFFFAQSRLEAITECCWTSWRRLPGRNYEHGS